jgi:hypothetical protein
MKTKCPGCSGERRKNQIVCIACWRRLPDALRNDFRHASGLEAKRTAVRGILDHFNGTPSFL